MILKRNIAILSHGIFIVIIFVDVFLSQNNPKGFSGLMAVFTMIYVCNKAQKKEPIDSAEFILLLETPKSRLERINLIITNEFRAYNIPVRF